MKFNLPLCVICMLFYDNGLKGTKYEIIIMNNTKYHLTEFSCYLYWPNYKSTLYDYCFTVSYLSHYYIAKP